MTPRFRLSFLSFVTRRGAQYLLPTIALFIVSCTYVPYDAPKTESHYVADTGATTLSKQLAPLSGGDSKIVVLDDGDDALAARLRMIENAEHTLDLQYFLIKPDEAGLIIAAALVDAAMRGVRVRFLIDDVFTTASDKQLNYLNSVPNIEVRYFNPLSRNSIQPVNYLLDFSRFNRRMHNKSMTADGVIAIVGGRNLANEYYDIDLSHNFADFDILVTGKAVDDIGDKFDMFWNDHYAVPLEAIQPRLSARELAEIAATIDESEKQSLASKYKEAANSDYLKDIAAGKAPIYDAKSQTVSDSPEKLRNPPPRDPVRFDETAAELVSLFANAKREIYLLSPYFVPRDWATDFFIGLEERGVEVNIITNSLAATNHAYVQGGYFPYRKRLIEAGVDIYEIRVDALDAVAKRKGEITDAPALTMHTKLAVVDGETSFVGSLNFDPRSIELNTEFGLFLHDEALTQTLTDEIKAGLDDYSYHLELNDAGELRWVYYGSAPEDVKTSEPEASFLQKLIATVASLLPIEGQL